jgi:hypothetical protein
MARTVHTAQIDVTKPRTKKARKPRPSAKDRVPSAQPKGECDEETERDDETPGRDMDPDGRQPPDHQHRTRDEGVTPEQAVIERAREQQSPPLNPDPARPRDPDDE